MADWKPPCVGNANPLGCGLNMVAPGPGDTLPCTCAFEMWAVNAEEGEPWRDRLRFSLKGETVYLSPHTVWWLKRELELYEPMMEQARHFEEHGRYPDG